MPSYDDSGSGVRTSSCLSPISSPPSQNLSEIDHGSEFEWLLRRVQFEEENRVQINQELAMIPDME
jgi:hypothetical protein